jgi:chromosome segregation protein
MRLKSLELIGFKSFSERTVLQFTPGITAIVGPNGCGKSNIVDALRWVMGEQSARHLRGRQMEDVIFNGSESRPGTGMAEVSLVLDNEDGRGPAEYGHLPEIMITRRLFRSGESEYLINRVPCRLKDIHELFLGTGVGNKAYSIVEQGRVEEIVSAKPEERRFLIEEVAGTSKYRGRKLAAERRLERTQQNLLRVNDILREIERQIRNTEAQAKRAERFRALREELREKEILLARHQKRKIEQEIASVEKRAGDVEAELVAALALLRSREAEAERLRTERLDQEKRIQALQDRLYEIRVELQREEQTWAFLAAELEAAEEEAKKVRTELAQLEEKERELLREEEGLRGAEAETTALLAREEAGIEEKEARLHCLRAELRELQAALDGERGRLMEALSEEARLRNDIAAEEKRREEIEAKLSRIAAEHESARAAVALWREKESRCRAALTEQQAHAKALAEEWDALQRKVTERKKLEQELGAELDALKEELQSRRSHRASLEALQRNYDGYHEGVRAIMRAREEGSGFDGVFGVVAEIIDYPKSYEKALIAVLGERLQYVIVRSHEEGLQAIEYLKRKASGRGSFIPQRSVRWERRPLPLEQPEIVGPLLAELSVKPGFENVAEFLLGDVVVVRDLASGLALWRRNGFFNTLVTPDGEVIDPMGVVSGGSAESLEASLLAQRRMIRELAAEIESLESELGLRRAALAASSAETALVEERQKALLERMREGELGLLRLQHELAEAEREIARWGEAADVAGQENADLSREREALAADLERLRASLAERSADKEANERRLEERQSLLASRTSEVGLWERELLESRVSLASLEQKKQHIRSNLQRLSELKDELRARMRAGAARLEQLEQKRLEVAAACASSKEAARKARESAEKGQAELLQLREIHAQLADRIASAEEEIRELRPRLDLHQADKVRLQLVLTEKRVGLEHLVRSMRETHGVDLTEVDGTSGAEVTAESLTEEIDGLRARLERIGEVNLAAITEFEELRGRYDFLVRQRDDLERAMADLRQTIMKLNRVCRVNFREAFEQVSGKFEEVFPRLFRGGRARLVLTDERDYLETGIEIVVQPPGKKLQSITPLSGGEKALTAVSLLFAIFLAKPTPFCVLDEVDAPLDDANIDRFNEMVREMSRESQFILITHNKRTMQSAEVLYGITMSDPGISKIVSVRMS